jgi:hypothetical protein
MSFVPNTEVACSTFVATQNVDLTMPELYYDTWYTIAIPANSSSGDNVCTQLDLRPQVRSDPDTVIDYFSNYQFREPRGAPTYATGFFEPIDATSPFLDLHPPYRLQLFFTLPDGERFVFGDGDFWVLAAAGDGSTTSAIVTYTCPRDGSDNAQIFFLSRQPYFVPPVTFDVLDNLARQAISNYDEFEMLQVPHQLGWCDYDYPTTFADEGVNCANLGEIEDMNLFDFNFTAETILILIVLLISLTTLVWLCVRMPSKSDGSSLRTSLLT